MLTEEEFRQAQTFIYTDIGREVAMAKATEDPLKRSYLEKAGVPLGGGNFMAALALLSYTEYAGRLKNNDFSDGNNRKNFNDFFTTLGTDYKKFLDSHNVYKIFRCGLAHEYYVKKSCVIAMLESPGDRMGIGYHNGQYFFNIEKYFADFRVAFSALSQCN